MSSPYDVWACVGDCVAQDIHEVLWHLNILDDYEFMPVALRNAMWGNKGIYVSRGMDTGPHYELVVDGVDGYLDSMSDHYPVGDRKIVDLPNGSSVQISTLSLNIEGIEIQLHICELL